MTGRPERPPDKFLGPRSQRVGFEKVNRPKGGEARISESRECNLKRGSWQRGKPESTDSLWVAGRFFAARN